jgi:hypothetical protein
MNKEREENKTILKDKINNTFNNLFIKCIIINKIEYLIYPSGITFLKGYIFPEGSFLSTQINGNTDYLNFANGDHFGILTLFKNEFRKYNLSRDEFIFVPNTNNPPFWTTIMPIRIFKDIKFSRDILIPQNF